MAREQAPPKPKDYDERIYRKGNPPHRIRNAVILIALVIAGTYLAITKELPWASHYVAKAVFANAANIRTTSPVRIAGVNVGKVQSVRNVGNAAEVTFTVDDAGRPIHTDAEVQIRPRIFLEGNFFLDLKPGSPSAPELPDGGTIPITRTSTSVQLDEVLAALQKPDRANLQALLEGFGTALNHVPTAAEDAGQDPSVQGESAAVALNNSFKYGEAAGRDSAIVAEALQGTEPHDLSRLINANRSTFATLVTVEGQLQDLITNFNTTAGALASESSNLSATFRELAPTLEIARPSLANLNRTLPYLRAFARDIRPGIAELPATIKAGTPWLKQAYKLTSKKELGNIADESQKIAPNLAVFGAQGPGLFNQTNDLSRCFSEVLIPAGNGEITVSPFNTGGPSFKDFFYLATNFSGAGGSFDGNGPYLRTQLAGGPDLVKAVNPNGVSGGIFPSDELWGNATQFPIGTQPVRGSQPPFQPDVLCHTNAVPDLNGAAAAVGAPTPTTP
ncbi:MAG: MCE family protein [Solirubrobacterales bacterium]|nr:MCE family protein [Solirubrobacterales bacterium]